MGFPSYIRKLAFARAGAKCEVCFRRWDKGFMLYAHHRLPANEGGENSLDNCEMLCKDCHKSKHQHLADLHRSNGNIKYANANAYAVRTISNTHDLYRTGWHG